MPPRTSRSSARIFAPLALAVCAVAVLIVIGGSVGGGGDSSDGDSAPPEQSDPTTAATSTTEAEARQRATYTVEPGDTLGAIAESTGVPVETLQELNPELDPQALIAGQKIKLRE
jgi:LysM repeat protein